jgi:nucleoside-diphosphate-sugar epimerase
MSKNEAWLVTGANGCIGAWTVLTLIREGVRVVGLDLGTDDHRQRLIFEPEEFEQLEVVHGDVADLALLERTLDEYGITHIVHLAALQVPFCKADPSRGAHVNVEGTAVVFEAAKRHELASSLCYASSGAVYDAKGAMNPASLYGFYKIACEGIAQVFWQDDAVASVGLRPLVVYGPGRDQGMTAGPTEAIAAAIKQQPHRIAFGGRTQLQYAPDVARAFVAAAREPAVEASVYNLGGPDIGMGEVVETIQRAVPRAEISFDDVPLPFPSRLPEPVFEMSCTPFEQGVQETVEVFRRQS